MPTPLPSRSPLPRRRSAALRLSAVSVAGLAAVLAGSVPSAWAAEQSVLPISSTSVIAPITVPQHVSADDAARAVAYWTPERMAAATVVGDSASHTQETSTGTAESTDAASIPAADTRSGHARSTTDGGSFSPISVAQQVDPVSHIGRVFYNLNGHGYACSANVVEAANRSTVATAGHCMTGGGAFATDSVFVPGYHDGDGDFGRWPVVGGVVAGGYTGNDDDQADDAGFLVVAHNDDGDDIQSVVGASPVLFNQSLTLQGSVYGYPAEGRFDGKSLQRCRGRFEAFGPEQIDLLCDMNGGVSGGPIFAGGDATGAQYAVEDARFNDSSHILGPIWQDNEHAAYTQAVGIDPGSAQAQG